MISDELVDLCWKSRHRIRPDHPVRRVIELFFRTFKQLLGCRHPFSDDHSGVKIQASCAMIVCMLILIYTGEKPKREMVQMVWYELIGLASLKELEAFIDALVGSGCPCSRAA